MLNMERAVYFYDSRSCLVCLKDIGSDRLLMVIYVWSALMQSSMSKPLQVRQLVTFIHGAFVVAF